MSLGLTYSLMPATGRVKRNEYRTHKQEQQRAKPYGLNYICSARWLSWKLLEEEVGSADRSVSEPKWGKDLHAELMRSVGSLWSGLFENDVAAPWCTWAAQNMHHLFSPNTSSELCLKDTIMQNRNERANIFVRPQATSSSTACYT